jgi:Transposase IS200 like
MRTFGGIENPVVDCGLGPNPPNPPNPRNVSPPCTAVVFHSLALLHLDPCPSRQRSRPARRRLVEYPPKQSVAGIVNAMKGVSSRMLRKEFPLRPHAEHLWSPSYFAGSCGGAPITVIRQYIENQGKSP